MATIYWVGGGSSGNWNATGNTNWGSASGTRDNQAVPTAAEDVVFDAHANGNTPCTVTATAACKSIVFTGAGGDWANTFKINDTFTLTVSGLVTLKNTFTWTQSTGQLLMGTAATLTNNSKEINCDFGVGNVTITVADTMHVNGDLRSTIGDSAALSAAGATALTCSKGLNCSRKLTCTNVNITCDGTGTWTGSTTDGRYLDGNVTINTAGTITMSNPSWGGGTLTYTGGTLSWGTSTLYLMESGTFSGTFPNFYNMHVTASATLTIPSAITYDGTVTLGANLTMSGNYGVTVGILTNSTAVSCTTAIAWTITTHLIAEACNWTWVGDYDHAIGTLNIRSAAVYKLANSQDLQISTAIAVCGTNFDTTTISSTTASNTSYITYAGAVANMKIAFATITDINFSGSTNKPIYNMWGGTLTRTTDVENVDSTDIGGASSDVFGIIG